MIKGLFSAEMSEEIPIPPMNDPPLPEPLEPNPSENPEPEPAKTPEPDINLKPSVYNKTNNT